MSHEAVSWALYRSPMLLTDAGRIDTTARAVLVVLAEHADATGRGARPSVLRIQFATGYDARTVSRALDRLEGARIVRFAGYDTHGVKKWTLAMSAERPESVWAALQEVAAKLREKESAKRAGRRYRGRHVAVSGTETPGQDAGKVGHPVDPNEAPPDLVRDGNSRMSGTQNPVSGTETPDVRDAVPTEPPLNHPGTTQGTTLSETADAVSGTTALAVVLRHPTGEVAPILDAQTITGAWVDHCAANNVKLPRNLIGRYAKGIKTALDQGFDAELIKRALARMLADGQASWPGSFDAYLVRVQQAAVAAPRQRRLTPGEDSARRLLAGEEPGQVIDAVNRFFERGAS